MKVKDIAAGFDEDAKHLLNDFLEVNSFEFPLFASIWKKYKFSLIFMGRPEDIELTEFTNEIFKKTSQILSSLSPLPYQAGVIFMLYALYQNQISVPPIKIRIKMDHWKVIDELRNEAIAKKYRSLHYVIDYLIKYALTPVAHQTLKGPIIASVQKLSKSSEIVANMSANYKADLVDYDCSSSLSKLGELQNKYFELKKSMDIVDQRKPEKVEVYKEMKEDIACLLDAKPRGRRSERSTSGNIGSRRSEIKAAAFMIKSKDFLGRTAESEDGSDSDDNQVSSVRPVASRSRRGKRAPHHERRVGRPRKTPLKQEKLIEEEEDDFDITHLLKQQKDFYLPPEIFDKGKNRTIRLPYYKLSPKHDDDDDTIYTGI